jgi:putative membrane protein
MQNMLGLAISLEQLLPTLISAVVFVAIGLVVFAIAFGIMTWIAPFSVRKEIEEDQNTSLAVLMGSIIIGIAIIIAAAIT